VIRRLGPVLALAALAACAPPATAEEAVPTPALKTALQAYHDSLSKLRWVVNDERMADLYERALVFARDPQVAADLAAFYDEASGVQKEALKETLTGVVLPGSGAPGPDRSFFAARTSKDKTPESREFFALLERLHPADPRAADKGKTGVGCSRLGDGSLSDVLRRLEAPRITQPFYRKVLEDERARVVREMTTASCICGDRGAAEAEIARWLKAHQDEPARRALEERAKNLGSNPELRFRCASAAR
jgi:hypothetical protein